MSAKESERKREKEHGISYSDMPIALYSSMLSDACIMLLARVLRIGWGGSVGKTLRILLVHSSIFGKFNTLNRCTSIVACTRQRFCRSPINILYENVICNYSIAKTATTATNNKVCRRSVSMCNMHRWLNIGRWSEWYKLRKMINNVQKMKETNQLAHSHPIHFL